ncbi:MAG: efflux RND transporter periplasmic adaptor subunit [Planctomycetaceae bacterium]|nr:efflux RND transporter periplasmic adaptor subunit [Planctomycetaceae bacterium]
MKLLSSLSVFLKVIVPATIGLAVLIAIIAALSGMFTEKIQPGRSGDLAGSTAAGNSETDVVHEIVQPYVAEAIGTLRAAARTDVSAQVAARILEIRVKAGDRVEVGDVLIRLDPSEFDAALAEAEAAVAEAEASARAAQQDYDRMAELLKQNAIAKAQYDAADRTLRASQAQLEQTRQAVARAKVRLGYTVIDAPQAGTIVDTLAEPGEIASPGRPLLTLYDLTSLRLEVPVMENLAGKIKPGDTLQVQIDALDNRQFEATVDEIVPQAQAASRSFLVKLRLPKIDGAYEGMFGRLKVPVGERRHLCLNQQAVQTIGQLTFVDVVRNDDTLERRMVKLGRVGMPGRVEVISGLEPNERVLLRPIASNEK